MSYKKSIVFIAAFLMLLFYPYEANATTMYANKDLNYPIWSTGNEAGSAFDLSSCFIVSNDGDTVVVKAINFYIKYTGGNGFNFENGRLENAGYVFFEKTRSVNIKYFWSDDDPIKREIETNSYEDEATDLAFEQCM